MLPYHLRWASSGVRMTSPEMIASGETAEVGSWKDKPRSHGVGGQSSPPLQ